MVARDYSGFIVIVRRLSGAEHELRVRGSLTASGCVKGVGNAVDAHWENHRDAEGRL